MDHATATKRVLDNLMCTNLNESVHEKSFSRLTINNVPEVTPF